MNPWISIAISTATTVILGLLGFIVKRELGRIKEDLMAIRTAHAEEVKSRQEAMEKLATDLKAAVEASEKKFLSREMFYQLEAARKEIDQVRRDSDQRLEGLLNDILSRMGGGRWKGQ